MEVIPIVGGKTLMDCIQIETTSIQIHRSARSSSCSLGNSGGCGSAETRNVILEPVQFVVNINRNISRPSEEFPNVGITLNMDTIKVDNIILSLTPHPYPYPYTYLANTSPLSLSLYIPS